MPIILAIETSQRVGSIALRDATGHVHEQPLRTARRHDDDLLPAIDRAVRAAKLAPADLHAVAVSVGPGGFTGLRIAVTTVKMFAEALNVDIVAVPSALVAAQATDANGETCLVALASKGDTFWATRVQRAAENMWRIIGEPGLMKADAIALDGIDAVLADEHLPEQARQRCREAGIDIVTPRLHARACLLVGESMLVRGETVDPLRLSPLYPRQPEAVSLWAQRTAGRK